jgi:hypothetical protein
VWQENNASQKSIYESAHIIGPFFEISTSSDRIWTAAIRELLSNSMQSSFFYEEKNIDC